MHDHKLETAYELGATHTINASTHDPVKEIRELTNGGVDYSFEAIGSKKAAEQCFECLRAGGTATIIGMIPVGQKIELEGSVFLREKKIQGSSMGSNRFKVDMPKYIDFYLQGRLKLDEMITREMEAGGRQRSVPRDESGRGAPRCTTVPPRKLLNKLRHARPSTRVTRALRLTALDVLGFDRVTTVLPLLGATRASDQRPAKPMTDPPCSPTSSAAAPRVTTTSTSPAASCSMRCTTPGNIRTDTFNNYDDGAAIEGGDLLVSYTSQVPVADEACAAIRRFLEHGGRWFAIHASNSVRDNQLPAGHPRQPLHYPSAVHALSRRGDRPERPAAGRHQPRRSRSTTRCTSSSKPTTTSRSCCIRTGAARPCAARSTQRRRPLMYRRRVGEAACCTWRWATATGPFDKPTPDSPDRPDLRGPWALPVYQELIRRGVDWAAARRPL